ncbi:hypothetical protein GCM10020255_026380 [Rhodococcus baikonurensis]
MFFPGAGHDRLAGVQPLPDRLELVLITDDPDGADWSAFKWLPHANDPTRMTPDGSARRIYRSLAEFVNDLPESVTERPAFRDNASSTTNEELPTRT